MSFSQRSLIATPIILLTALLPGLAIDIYLPSLPALCKHFNASSDQMQLTISFYLFGYALVQFIIGRVIDSIGRYKPYLISMFIFILTTYIIASVNINLYSLLALRLVQGISIGTVLTAARAMISDLFTGEKYQKITNNYISLWAMGPIIAPVIGGYLQHSFGWQANFYCLDIFAIILFTLHCIFNAETIQVKRVLNLRFLLLDYKAVLSNKEYLAGVGILGLVYSIVILYNMVATFLFQNVLKLSVIQYGHIAMLIGITWFLGNFTNRALISINTYNKVNLTLTIMVLTILTALFLNYYFPPKVYSILIPAIILVYCSGIIYPNYYTNCIALFPTLSATAGSLMSGISLLITTCFGSGIGAILNDNSSLQLDIGLTVLIALTLLVYAYMRISCHIKT